MKQNVGKYTRLGFHWYSRIEIHPGKLTWNLKITLFEKENHLNQTCIFGFKMLIFRGFSLFCLWTFRSSDGHPSYPSESVVAKKVLSSSMMPPVESGGPEGCYPGRLGIVLVLSFDICKCCGMYPFNIQINRFMIFMICYAHMCIRIFKFIYMQIYGFYMVLYLYCMILFYICMILIHTHTLLSPPSRSTNFACSIAWLCFSFCLGLDFLRFYHTCPVFSSGGC